MDRIRLRQIQNYQYDDPAAVLPSIDCTDPRDWERYQAFLFARFVQMRDAAFRQTAVSFTRCVEYDCVIRQRAENQTDEFYRVQLKSCPGTPQKKTVQKTIDDAAEKYGEAPDLILAIWIN